MGTNFYWIPIDRDAQQLHIGKRSAAGLYCWDCHITLCRSGAAEIHSDRAHSLEANKRAWHVRCPRCNKEPVEYNPLEKGPSAVELGFAQPSVERPTGVRGAASFSWAQDPNHVRQVCLALPNEKDIWDEYGRTYTRHEFMEMLNNNCPIEFVHSIGLIFS